LPPTQRGERGGPFTVSGVTGVRIRRPVRGGTGDRRPASRPHRAPHSIPSTTVGADRGKSATDASSREIPPARSLRHGARAGIAARGSAWRWTPWLALALVATLGALAAGVPLLAAVCIAVLAGAATLLGWFFGE